VAKSQTQSKRIKEKITAAIKDQTLMITLIQITNNSIKTNYLETIQDKTKNLRKTDNKVKFLRIKKTIFLELEDRLEEKWIQNPLKI
jgi:hypothetical protein